MKQKKKKDYLIGEINTKWIRENELLNSILVYEPLTTLEDGYFMNEFANDLKNLSIDFWDNLYEKAFNNNDNARESQIR